MTNTSRFIPMLPLLGAIFTVIILTHSAYQYFNLQWITYRKAEVSYEAKQWSEASALYNKAFDQGLSYPGAMLRMAQAYMELRDYPKSVSWYKKYLEVNPKDVWVRRALAGALTANGEFEQAEKEYRLLLEPQHDD